MISKSIQESNKSFFVKNTKAKILLQKLNQTERQIEMLFTKRNIQLNDLISLIEKQMSMLQTKMNIQLAELYSFKNK